MLLTQHLHQNESEESSVTLLEVSHSTIQPRDYFLARLWSLGEFLDTALPLISLSHRLRPKDIFWETDDANKLFRHFRQEAFIVTTHAMRGVVDKFDYTS